MSFGIYKPNQGYWVRVMTAIFAGVLVLSGAVWVWSQMQAVPLPMPTWRISMTNVQGSLTPGETVRFIEESTGEPLTFATANVESYETDSAGGATMLVGNIAITEPGMDLTLASRVGAESAGKSFSARMPSSGGAIGVEAFERTYLQGIGAGAVILVGSTFIFWLVGNKRRSVEFLIATDGEMKKVNWSTRREVYGSTVVVVVATFLIAAVLFVIDLGFAEFFESIGVLQR